MNTSEAAVLPGSAISGKRVLGGLGHFQTAISSGLDDVAFLDPDGTRVVFAYNTGATPISFAIRWHHSLRTYRIPPHATTTLRWR